MINLVTIDPSLSLSIPNRNYFLSLLSVNYIILSYTKTLKSPLNCSGKNVSVNLFKLGKEEYPSNRYQCRSFELQSSNYMELGNQIVIHKGTPIMCGSILQGFVSEAIYQKGQLVIQKFPELDENDLIQQHTDDFERIPIVNDNGYQPLRTSSITIFLIFIIIIVLSLIHYNL